MRRVWALSSGSYSDYTVLAIFETKEDAEAAAAMQGPADDWHSDKRVEEMSYYPKGGAPKVVRIYDRQAQFWDDGTVDQERENHRDEWEYDPLHGPASKRPSVRFVRPPIQKNKGGRLEVRGLDKRAVDKAFSENAARIKVNIDQTGKAAL